MNLDHTEWLEGLLDHLPEHPDRVFQPPPSPPWRDFKKYFEGTAGESPMDGPDLQNDLAGKYIPNPLHLKLVRASLHLRRPLLLIGSPGLGKSGLANYVATVLRLGPVLRWPVTSRSTLKDGLYHYDAVARLQELQRERPTADTNSRSPQFEPVTPAENEGRFFTLGPLGTALAPWSRPRVLLIDEIDKSDLDFPNDLLHVLEEGWFEIPELRRLPKKYRLR